MNEWKNVALFWGKNYPKNLLDKVRLLHYSNYRKQNKQEQNLKKKIISWTPRGEERFSTRPEILMTRIRVINFIEVQLSI